MTPARRASESDDHPPQSLSYSALMTFDTAERAYRRFSHAWRRVAQAEPLGISITRDLPKKSLIFSATSIPASPTELSQETHTIFTSLASTLEHLATGLATRANDGKELEDYVAGKITFPVYTDRHRFDSKKGEIAKYFRSDDWALIEQLQPFNGAAPYWGSGFRGSWHPVPTGLHILSTYAKTLRHRRIEVVLHGFANSPHPNHVNGEVVQSATKVVQVTEPGSFIGAWNFRDRLPEDDPPMEALMDFFQLVPRLGDGVFDSSKLDIPEDAILINDLDELLQMCLSVILTVMLLFKPALEFGQGPEPISRVLEWQCLT